MKYVALYSVCSTRGTVGLGSSLSIKHLPPGRTNLQGLREPVFSTGFTGASNPSIISELQNGKVGSIFADLTSDTVRFVVFFVDLDLILGTVWATALGLTGGCMAISHRSTAVSLVLATGGGSKQLTVLAASHVVEVLDEQVEADGMGTGVLPSGGKSCEQVTVVAAASHGSPITVLRMGVLDEHCDTVLDAFWEDDKTSLTLA